jgi:glycosyltransferase involved in cell wall biosynthesis
MSWKDDIIKPDRNYKVVIRCSTYNQEKYIEDALKGFVRQKTNFPFCAVVVDDCSTDRNAEIIRRYERQYPDIIKGIYLQENMFHNPEKGRFVRPWIQSAEYIALCEGDDYWIDDYKLQRQVDFLDSHPEYVLAFHNAIVRHDNHDNPDRLISDFVTGDFTTEMIFDKWQLPLASVVYRRTLLSSQVYNEFREKVMSLDLLIFTAATMIGKVYGLSECLSVYRKNNGGVTNQMNLLQYISINYRFAHATQNEKAVRALDFVYRKLMSVVIANLIFGKQVKESKDILSVCWSYSHRLIYTSVLLFPLIRFGEHLNRFMKHVYK